jgi:hypothetical protein
MKKLLLIAILAIAGFMLFSLYQGKPVAMEPLYPEPYIVIYGRKTDGNTVHMMSALHSRGYRYYFSDVDAAGVNDGLHKRMKQCDLATNRYTLPVVDVNTRMRTNPKPEWVIENYRIDHTGKKI